MNRNTTLALSGGWMLFLLLAMSLLYATVLRSPPPVGKLLPSVVRITTHAFVADDNSDLSGGGRPAAKVQESFGSGVIVDRDGYIVTNRHVVKGAYEIIVHLDDGTPLRARLVGHGGAVDLALIKIDTDRNPEPAKFGDSDRLSIGDSVYVVGNPFGLGTAVSSGIVSVTCH